MDKGLLSAAIALAALGGACSHQHQTTTPTGSTYQPGTAYVAPQDEDSVFDRAWGSVKQGARKVAHAGEWTFEKAEDGSVVAYHGVKRVAGRTADVSKDAALQTAVKSRLVAAKDIKSSDIDVDARDGIVTLRGQVDSQAHAAKAVRVALNTRGVDQVVSYLTWR